jgi:hypothetical protein
MNIRRYAAATPAHRTITAVRPLLLFEEVIANPVELACDRAVAPAADGGEIAAGRVSSSLTDRRRLPAGRVPTPAADRRRRR